MSLRPATVATVASLQRLLTGRVTTAVAVAASQRFFMTATARPMAGTSQLETSLTFTKLSPTSILTGLTSPIAPLAQISTRQFASQKKGNKKGKHKKEEESEGRNESQAAWAEFQQSIAVDGFETGQTTTAAGGDGATKTRTRGGKRVRKKSKEQIRLEEQLEERKRMTAVGGGEFPPLQYSPAETERLLAQAYAAIPPRAGKRGTRNLKRQQRRWWLVRQIRKKYKQQKIAAHERRMMERSRKVKSVKAVLAAAPTVQAKDKEYQAEVYARWVATMYPNETIQQLNKPPERTTTA